MTYRLTYTSKAKERFPGYVNGSDLPASIETRDSHEAGLWCQEVCKLMAAEATLTIERV